MSRLRQRSERVADKLEMKEDCGAVTQTRLPSLSLFFFLFIWFIFLRRGNDVSVEKLSALPFDLISSSTALIKEPASFAHHRVAFEPADARSELIILADRDATWLRWVTGAWVSILQVMWEDCKRLKYELRRLLFFLLLLFSSSSSLSKLQVWEAANSRRITVMHYQCQTSLRWNEPFSQSS